MQRQNISSGDSGEQTVAVLRQASQAIAAKAAGNKAFVENDGNHKSAEVLREEVMTPERESTNADSLAPTELSLSNGDIAAHGAPTDQITDPQEESTSSQAAE